MLVLVKSVHRVMLANTVKAKKPTVLPLPMPLFAWVAPRVGPPKQAAPSANRVALGRTALGVNHVTLVTIATAAIQMLFRVDIAHQVITTMTSVKVLVYHVYRVNSMISLVPLNANSAKKTLLPMIKSDKSPVTNAPLVEPPKKAVPNVPIVHPVNLKTLSTTNKSVLNAQRGLLKVKQIKPIALNAGKEKKHQLVVAVFVRCVVWVDSI